MSSSSRLVVRTSFLCVFLCLTVLGCSSAGDKDLHTMVVGDTEFQVEIADTEEARRVGLMNRDHLPEGQGMLFVFDRDQRLSFWMRNTSIPLSIAYISSDGVVREIHDMTPFSLDPVRSSRSVRYALEVNQGAFSDAGIQTGDRVVLPDR
ncbi:MAG: DUF192 domain-containing protein [Spirochaetaceae bacterium]